MNCLRVNTHNSYAHELTKFQVFWALRKRGDIILTEGIFDKGGMPDIVCLNSAIIWEILASETVAQFRKKTAKYPKNYEIRYIKSDREFLERDLD